MNMIRKYGLFAVGIGLVLAALAASLVTSPARAQVRADGINDGANGGANGGANNQSSLSTPARDEGSMMDDVDRHFIEQMIPHHQSAIDMADLALQKTQRPEIKILAANIKRAQQSEIDQMQVWYKSWYGTEVPASDMDAGQMMGNGKSGMMGTMMGSTGHMCGDMKGMKDMMGMGAGTGMGMMDMSMDLDALAKAADFDKTFIEMMVPHHRMALMMSNMVLAHSEKAELRTLAKSIITGQSDEIDQMQAWYTKWSPATKKR